MLFFSSKNIPLESVVEVYAIVNNKIESVQGCSIKEIELNIQKIFVISEAGNLPFNVIDLSIPIPWIEKQEEEIEEIDKKIHFLKTLNESSIDIENQIKELNKEKFKIAKYFRISLSTRLQHRVVDLRTLANQSIFRLKSVVCQLFRNFLLETDFIEIRTPKIISNSFETRSSFEIDYFKEYAFLNNNPLIYKQMAICADMERVFEIGPNFVNANNNTHRHLSEYTRLDIEMVFNDHYHEVLEFLEKLFFFVFEKLKSGSFENELNVIRLHFGSTLPQCNFPLLRIDYSDAIHLLNENNVFDLDPLSDISTSDQFLLSKLIKEKYNTDFFLLDKFPLQCSSFYSIHDFEDKRFSNSFRFFLNGFEFCSGSQRIHDFNLLKESAQFKLFDIHKIQFYLNSFKYGVSPHAGCGLGLERFLMLFLGLGNIRNTSLFPKIYN